MQHNERVSVARELQNERVKIAEVFPENITKELRYFSEEELANRGNYRSLQVFRDQLEYARLTEGGYFTDLGHEFGKAGLEAPVWRLEVLDYIKDYYEERSAVLLTQEQRINNYR